MYNWKYKNMEKSRKPNGKNIEIALELLELSLFLKNAVKKQRRKKYCQSMLSHKYLYLICHFCEGRNPEPKPLDSRFHGNDERT
jgi:hypothetical protein